MHKRIVECISGNEQALIFTTTQAQAVLDIHILAHEIELPAAIFWRTHIRDTRVKVKVKPCPFIGRDHLGPTQAMETVHHKHPTLLILRKIERKFLGGQTATAVIQRSDFETVYHLFIYRHHKNRLIDHRPIVIACTVNAFVNDIFIGRSCRFKWATELRSLEPRVLQLA